MSKGPVGRLLAGVAVAALVSGCQTVREQESGVKPEVAHAYLADKPAELKKHFYVSLTQGKRNQVLNDMRLGLAALEMDNDKLAAELFDDALGNIETIYSNNEDAAKARQLFTKELVKDFKGEPYERAMAYYYRGLLYMRGGDYDNARASFKGGFLQDSFADEDQNRADFGLFPFLQGWASRCRGNPTTAQDDFNEFRAINSSFPMPGNDDNVLVLAETGAAPVKLSGTDPNSSKPRYLKFMRVSASEGAQVRLTETFVPPTPKGAKKPPAPETQERVVKAEQLENIFFQASSRGGREFDSILQGKAQFKQGANIVGDVAAVGAAVAATRASYSGNRNDAAAAGVLLLLAVAAKAAAEAAEPDADTRYWDNLPDRVHATTLKLPAAIDRLSVDFLAPDGSVLRTKEVPVVRAGNCGLAWVRGQSAFPVSPRAPYSTTADSMSAPVVIPPMPAAPAVEAPPSQPESAATGTEPKS